MTCDVSIILCTRNRADILRATLEHLAKILVPGQLTAELIVVDSASKDNTKQVVQACTMFQIPVRYLFEETAGQSRARNAGMAAANGSIFLHTDDDVRPGPGWVDGMCTPIAEGQADAVAGGVACAPHLHREWMNQGLGWCFAITPNHTFNSDPYMVGANMAFTRRALDAVPGFDPELGPGALGFGEESLFCRQLQIAGMRVLMRPHVSVEHHFEESRLTRESLITDAKKRGQSAAYLNYHWEHNSPAVPYLRWLLAKLHLCGLLLRYPVRKGPATLPPLNPALHDQYSRVAYWRQMCDEKRRPRLYERHGLKKQEASPGDTVKIPSFVAHGGC